MVNEGSSRFWCPACKCIRAPSELKVPGDSDRHQGHAHYVKFDISRDSLKNFPELAEVMKRVGAYKSSLIIWTAMPTIMSGTVGLALHPDADYAAIKAPTLEGTEIWIGAHALQKNFESAAGFEKLSEPLLIFKAEKLHQQKARHPLNDEFPRIVNSDQVSLARGTGVVPVAGTPDGEGPHADFIVQELSDSGHLIQSSEIQSVDQCCHQCGSMVLLQVVAPCLFSPGELDVQSESEFYVTVERTTGAWRLSQS